MKENLIRKVLFFSIIIGCFCCTGNAFTQKNKAPMDPMEKDGMTLNFGFGPGIQYYGGYGTGFGPGFQVSFEKGMWKLGPGVLTLGGELGFSLFNHSGLDYKYTWFTSVGAVRSAYHYGWNVRGLDTYGGFSTGIRFLVFNSSLGTTYSENYNPGSVYPFVGTFVGASYFFNDIIGINGEMGYNINYTQIGMIFKLR